MDAPRRRWRKGLPYLLALGAVGFCLTTLFGGLALASPYLVCVPETARDVRFDGRTPQTQPVRDSSCFDFYQAVPWKVRHRLTLTKANGERVDLELSASMGKDECDSCMLFVEEKGVHGSIRHRDLSKGE